MYKLNKSQYLLDFCIYTQIGVIKLHNLINKKHAHLFNMIANYWINMLSDSNNVLSEYLSYNLKCCK
jgi:hypothetical protein